MNRTLTIFIAAFFQFQNAQADTYYRNKNEYSTSGAAKQYFGSTSSYERSNGLDFGRIEAHVSTRMDCGRIDLVTDFEAQFKKLRNQATAFVKNIDGYVRAAPMMTLCYTMPQVCALIRHDHFAFAQNLNLRAQACAAIDKFIDNQADKGGKQLEAEAKRNCIEGKLSAGKDMASATESCQGQTGMPLRDLSSGLRKQFINGPQRVLFAMLGHVGEQQSYNYLAAMLGEIEIQTDGYWQPLWPRKMLKPYEVARNTLQETITAVCTNLDGILNAASAGNDAVKETIKEKLTREDLSNLSDLLNADRQMACAALGRALGATVVKRTAAKNQAIVVSALTNGALPEGLKEEYRRRSETAFETLRLAVESEQIPLLEEVRNALRDLANAQRKYNRIVAASLSQSRNKNDAGRLEEQTDCVDTQSCQ